jgi:hypothetical protein
MDLDGGPITQHLGEESTVEGEQPDPVIPHGVIVIEELDTPAIRREKNMRRKAEKLQAAKAAAAVERSSRPPLGPDPEAGPSRLPADPSTAIDSDLSSLSDSDVDEGLERNAGSLPASSWVPGSLSNAPGTEEELGAVTFPLEGGTLGASYSLQSSCQKKPADT